MPLMPGVQVTQMSDGALQLLQQSLRQSHRTGRNAGTQLPQDQRGDPLSSIRVAGALVAFGVVNFCASFGVYFAHESFSNRYFAFVRMRDSKAVEIYRYRAYLFFRQKRVQLRNLRDIIRGAAEPWA
jgi:hypothetical protein